MSSGLGCVKNVEMFVHFCRYVCCGEVIECALHPKWKDMK